MALAATLLFTSPGAPCVYYGDEIGLPGGQDPDCRRPFPWDRAQWNLPLFQHYRALIQLRQSRGEWRHGAVQTLTVRDEALVFARHTDWEATVVAVNRGDQALSLEIPVWQLPLQVRQWRGVQPGHAGPVALELLDGGHPRAPATAGLRQCAAAERVSAISEPSGRQVGARSAQGEERAALNCRMLVECALPAGQRCWRCACCGPAALRRHKAPWRLRRPCRQRRCAC